MGTLITSREQAFALWKWVYNSPHTSPLLHWNRSLFDVCFTNANSFIFLNSCSNTTCNIVRHFWTHFVSQSGSTINIVFQNHLCASFITGNTVVGVSLVFLNDIQLSKWVYLALAEYLACFAFITRVLYLSWNFLDKNINYLLEAGLDSPPCRRENYQCAMVGSPQLIKAIWEVVLIGWSGVPPTPHAA